MLKRDTSVTSTASGGGNCVEVGRSADDEITVRHSRDVGVMLRFSAAEWSAFLAGVKAGEFDID